MEGISSRGPCVFSALIHGTLPRAMHMSHYRRLSVGHPSIFQSVFGSVPINTGNIKPTSSFHQNKHTWNGNMDSVDKKDGVWLMSIFIRWLQMKANAHSPVYMPSKKSSHSTVFKFSAPFITHLMHIFYIISIIITIIIYIYVFFFF